MAVLKCKMCGGDLTIESEQTVRECEYCGTRQTVPKADNEKKITLYERANRLRYNCEFDKAQTVYESIVSEFPDEAESYWGLVLCKYGIEYVDDQATGKKIPTCHRSSFDSVMDDADFEMVMENADSISRQVYREQAKQIEEIRKGIIEVSGKEEPYDIFICYKETSEDGQRTLDSVLAQDVYDVLTAKGYRVFFSRITLEDKLGTEYEPYIFAALNSAKIMLAFGTTYDYYNAVWVKNEWSRYLKLMAKDKNKHLIPCYKDIDAYDIPKEFARLQAQDMGKVGAVQDLLRGIDKIFNADGNSMKESAKNASVNMDDIKAAVASAVSASTGTNIETLITRGFMALEDDEWDSANKFFEDALNHDAKCGHAYLGKLFIKHRVKNITELEKFYEKKYGVDVIERLYACEENIERINNSVSKYRINGYLEEADIRKLYDFDRSYGSEIASRKKQKVQALEELSNEKLLKRVQKYADDELIKLIEQMIVNINQCLDKKIEEAEKADNENIALVKANYSNFLNKADLEAAKLYADGQDKLEEAMKQQEKAYNDIFAMMKEAEENNSVFQYEKIKTYIRKKGLIEYKDSRELITQCNCEIEKIRAKKEAQEERVYNDILEMMKAADSVFKYEEIKAYIREKGLIEYKDSKKLIEKCDREIENIKVKEEASREEEYNLCISLMSKARTVVDYDNIISRFQKLDGYKNSTKLMVECYKKIDDIKERESIERLRIEQIQISNENADQKLKNKVVIIICVVAVFVILSLISMAFSV